MSSMKAASSAGVESLVDLPHPGHRFVHSPGSGAFFSWCCNCIGACWWPSAFWRTAFGSAPRNWPFPTRACNRRSANGAKAENALRSSEEILRATLESLRDGVLVVDAQGMISHTNQRFSTIWQIPDHVLATRQDSVLLRHVGGLLQDPELFVTQVAAAYASLDDTLDRIALRDGRVIERTSTLFRKDGKASGRVWLFRDITDRVRAEEDQVRMQAQLTQAHKMEALGTLAGGVAHDFNNILQVIYGTMQLLGDPDLHAADRDRYLGEVRNAVERASELVQQLMSYSRQVEPGRKIWT